MEAVTADGVQLALRRFGPRGSGRGAALLLHAMMVDGRYLRRLAEQLAADGLDAFVLDWRGHGASVPPDPRRDRWTFDDYVAFDLPCAQAAAARAAGCEPDQVALCGHSLGGLVAAAALGTGAVRAPRLALLATSVWLPGPDGPLARRAIMALYRGVARALGRAPIRALRLGTDDEQLGYVEQLTDWARTGRWTSRLGVDYAAALPAIAAPTRAWVGTADRLCRPADARAIVERIPGATLATVDGADHFTMFTRAGMLPFWRAVGAALG